MKVYSWNVWCYNRRFEEARQFIANLDFDILCLQEVTPELLSYLQGLPYDMAYHTDVIRKLSSSAKEVNYVAILSRHPIRHWGTFQFPDFNVPFRTRLFVTLMRPLKWLFVMERGAVYADILIGEQAVRVFSVHLTLWAPDNRAAEFEIVAQHVPEGGSAIIAGDFNVLEYAPMKLLNWLFGGPLVQALPWYPERAFFEDRFKQHGFKNPLRGSTTHDVAHSQLDHILIGNQLTVTEAQVISDTHGSDHHPITVTIDFKP